MLMRALEGWTDEELAAKLGKSLPTIKKTWRSAYQRVEAKLPGLELSQTGPGTTESKRGREKKRRLLGYLRDHPEELRPFGHGTVRLGNT